MNTNIYSIRIPKSLWQEMLRKAEEYARENPSMWLPLVFALYTREDNHYEVINYRVAPVQEKGSDDYTCPGMRKRGFYPGSGEGKWFSGTLIIGDGTELDDGDKFWMQR